MNKEEQTTVNDFLNSLELSKYGEKDLKEMIRTMAGKIVELCRQIEKVQPKQEREPISDEEIRVIINQLPKSVDLDTGIEFCRIIEKAHGIGVDDE